MIKLSMDPTPTAEEDSTHNRVATRAFRKIQSKGFDVSFRRSEWKTSVSVETAQKGKRSAVTTDVKVTRRFRRWFFDLEQDGESFGLVTFDESEDGKCGRWGFSSPAVEEALKAK